MTEVEYLGCVELTLRPFTDATQELIKDEWPARRPKIEQSP